MASYLIVSRDFWPNAASIGDGLMHLAKRLSESGDVSVVAMSKQNLPALDSATGGYRSGSSFFTASPLTNSSSSLSLRIVELFYFSTWVLVSLLRTTPSVVYVSTNPPLLTPFTVALYCKIFRKQYVYHVQDIHPEAASLSIKLPRLIYIFLQKVDTWVLKNANQVITLTNDMKETLQNRGLNGVDISLIENPSLMQYNPPVSKINGVVFAGNAGRFQLMDVVLPAIDRYLKSSEGLEFCFVGAGVYQDRLLKLSKKYQNFSYHGRVDAESALKITGNYRWALLPIMPEILSFAYPSKIPTYIAAGCEIISITDPSTSLARWVKSSGCGKNVKPSIDALVEAFNQLEARSSAENLVERSVSFPTPADFSKQIHQVIKKI